MVPQLSHTWRGSESPGGTRSTSLAPHFEQKLSGGKGMLRGLLPRLPDQGRQLGKACDNVIGCGAQLIDGCAGPVDPESPESERLRPARIPAVARDKAYRPPRRAKPLHREPVHGGRGLVDFPLIDADDRSDQAAQSGILDHRPQHRRRAVREGRKSKVCVDEPAAAIFIELEAERRAGVAQGRLGHPSEILIAAHQAALPGVLELLGPPQLAQRRALSRPQLLAQRDHGVHVEERSVGVENQRAQGRQGFLQGTGGRPEYTRARTAATAVMTTAALPPSRITLAPRISLALVGLMVSLPFLNFHHSFPLPTFYTEWISFALGTLALFGLVFASREGGTRIPFLSLGLIALAFVLVIQVAAGKVAYFERSLLGALYLVWAALLVWLGAHLREHLGLERVGLVLQAFVAAGGFLVAITGFMMYYQIDLAGFRLISGAGMDGMYGTIAQRNNFANYLGCALASVVFLFGRGRLGLPLATLLAVPLVLGLVLSISRSAWIYVVIVFAAAWWMYWLGDRGRLKPLAVFSSFVLVLFVGLNFVVAYSSWFPGTGAQMLTLGERWVQTVSSDQAELGLQIRVYLLKEAWTMFATHPVLGVGFGEFASNLLEHGAGFDGRNPAMAINAHNVLLGLLAETGLLGTLCVAVPLALWLRAIPWSKPDLDAGWVLAIIAIESAHSMVEFPLWHANFLGLAVVVLGAVAQPAVKLRFSRFRQTALTAVLAAGIATLGGVLSDYRNFERWYRQADASQRKGVPLSAAQLKDLADQRATSLFAGYYDLLASELLILDRDDLEAKVELNTRVLRFIPIPTTVFRQAILKSLKGEHEEAAKIFSRLATIYPHTLQDFLKDLDQMAQDDPAAFGMLAAEAKRRYRP